MFPQGMLVNFVVSVLGSAVGISVFYFLRWLVRGLIEEDFPSIKNPGARAVIKKPLWNHIQQLATTNKTTPNWIVTNSVALYSYFTDETLKKSRFFIIRNDGLGVKPLDLSLLVHPGKKSSEVKETENLPNIGENPIG